MPTSLPTTFNRLFLPHICANTDLGISSIRNAIACKASADPRPNEIDQPNLPYANVISEL